jgi:hypothetical protein
MMTHPQHDFGFRVLGGPSEPRNLVIHDNAFRAHCECDPKAEPDRECYLSAFSFPESLEEWYQTGGHGSPRGYTGPSCSRWLWFDIDRPSLVEATDAARRLASFLVARWVLDEDDLLLFFSGSKGYHLGLPLSRCGNPPPSVEFNSQCKTLATTLAERAGVDIDQGVYDRQRIFRAPNSRHPKTDRHKRRLSFDELLQVTTEGIQSRAAKPLPFELPAPPAPHPQALSDWTDSREVLVKQARERAEQKMKRQAGSGGPERLNRGTLEFIRNGATEGDRHRLLYSAAANLGEFGCSPSLATALLFESARDSGLPPADITRAIRNGLERGAGP